MSVNTPTHKQDNVEPLSEDQSSDIEFSGTTSVSQSSESQSSENGKSNSLHTPAKQSKDLSPTTVAAATPSVKGGASKDGECATKAAPKSPEASSSNSFIELETMTYQDAVNGKQFTNSAFAGEYNLRSVNYYLSATRSDTKAIENADSIQRGTMRRVFRELRDLAGYGSGGLVLSPHCSMFLRCDELYPQYLRAVITGVSATPYAYGAFVFDIYLPSDYPHCPPKCIHLTPGTQNVYGNHTPGGMSPNLHRDSGKVCLSLLGTWDGPGWDKERSSIYQLLTTISFQILAAEEPYYMEPSYGGWEGTAPSTASKVAITYKEEVQRGTLQYGIIAPLETILEGKATGVTSKNGSKESPWSSFEEVLLRHFFMHRTDIVSNCLKWYKQTNCLYHKHALRWLTLRSIQLLHSGISKLRGIDFANAYMKSSLEQIEAPMSWSSGSTVLEAAPANHPAGSSCACTPWKNQDVDKIFFEMVHRLLPAPPKAPPFPLMLKTPQTTKPRHWRQRKKHISPKKRKGLKKRIKRTGNTTIKRAGKRKQDSLARIDTLPQLEAQFAAFTKSPLVILNSLHKLIRGVL